MLVCLSLALFLSPGTARAQPYAAMVMDMRSGEVYHATNADTPLHPASLTKMMTLYIAFEAIANGEITLDTQVLISANAARTECSCLGVRAGQRIALRYLIRAAAIRSGNDAAVAIAEAISGSEEAFAERMTRTARAMGMRNTTFRNPHGLTQTGHMSTARDMTILGRQLYFDYPQYYNIFSRRTADAGIATVANTNRRFLDAYRGADGIKTGYTRAAGFNLVASAERNGERIIATIFGGRSTSWRNTRMMELMDMGFAEAPRQVAVRRPARVPYQGPGGPGAAALVVAGTGTTGGGNIDRPAAGRIIRLNTAVTRSPRPQPRPGAAEPPVPDDALIASIRDEVSAVLAAVAAPDPAPASAADLAAPEPPLPVAVAVADAGAAPTLSPRPEERPQDLAAALPFAVAEPETVSRAGLPFAVAAQDAPAALPEVLAETLAEAADAPETPSETPPEAVAEAAAPPAEAGTPVDDAALVIAALPAEEAPLRPLARPAPAAEAEGGAAAETVAAAVVEAAVDAATPQPEDPAPLLAEALPDPDTAPLDTLRAPDEGDAPPVLAMAAPDMTPIVPGLTLTQGADPLALPEPPATVADGGAGGAVLLRVSTQSPRVWSIRLGALTTRDRAERLLMRVALAETATLEGALRRIETRNGQHEALMVGLSEEQARRACVRLNARGQACEPLAP